MYLRCSFQHYQAYTKWYVVQLRNRYACLVRTVDVYLGLVTFVSANCLIELVHMLGFAGKSASESHMPKSTAVDLFCRYFDKATQLTSIPCCARGVLVYCDAINSGNKMCLLEPRYTTRCSPLFLIRGTLFCSSSHALY